jgi:hypothetical protein
VPAISADQLNPATPPEAAAQNQDFEFVKRKLELRDRDAREAAAKNEKLNQRVRELEEQAKKRAEDDAKRKAASLDPENKALYEGERKRRLELEQRVLELEAELQAKDKEFDRERMNTVALGDLANQGVNAPDQLLTILQARFGLRRGESGGVDVVVDGLSTPLNDFLQQLKQSPEWQHHFSASGGRGMGAGPVPTSSVAPGVANPFRKETWNLTQQYQLKMQNPELAEALQAEAQRG